MVPRQMIAIAMLRVRTLVLEPIGVHAMKVLKEMESLVQVCLIVNCTFGQLSPLSR